MKAYTGVEWEIWEGTVGQKTILILRDTVADFCGSVDFEWPAFKRVELTHLGSWYRMSDPI